MTGNPADIGGTPVNVAVMIIEDIFKGGGCVNQIAAGGVQYAFRFTRRAGGIEDKQRIFRIDFNRLMFRAGVSGERVPPQVTAFVPVNFPTGPFKHHDVFNGFHVRVFQGVINVLFERNSAPGAHAFIGGDHQPGAGINNTSGNGLRREAAEND